MKKVLILSIATGQGHISTARAIKEYFELQGVECEIYEALNFLSKPFAKFISWGHSFIYRYLPGLFRVGYGFSEKFPSIMSASSLVYWILVAGSKKLRQHIVDGNFDTVICTHIFAAVMLTNVQEKSPLPIKTAFVTTDHTIYPGIRNSALDKNFVSDESMVEVSNTYGDPRSRAVASGIPVGRSFFQKYDKAEAKRQLHLNEKMEHLLVMSGSMGGGPVEDIMQQLVKELPEEVELTVICGTNKILYDTLIFKYGENPRIHVVGYTDQVALYMASADLCLTKPGGISVTEAAAMNLPTVYANSVQGCEQYNVDFFVGMGAAATARNIKGLADKCVELLQSPAELRAMEEALREYHQPDGAVNIYKELSQPKNDEVPVGETEIEKETNAIL